ncbi:MAG: selenoneine biosynthesis selenosugar synthase SenB [Vulcanimicrobiaceae bacterium]
MTIGIVYPAGARSSGNGVSARRYARFFRSAGNRVRLLERYGGEDLDALVALHAKRSGRSALAFAAAHPDRPLIVVLTGTDLYRDLPKSKLALRALHVATRLITLQPAGIAALPRALRRKAVAIVQSATVAPAPAGTAREPFTVCVIGHLRAVKDPLRAGYALRFVPRALPLRVLQIGGALDPAYAARALALERREPRYRWLGELSPARAHGWLRRCDLLVLPSKMEGGANVLCEAIAAGIPVVASRIGGNVGILGRSYPGYFPVGDTAACAALMVRAATDPTYRRTLRAAIVRLRPLVSPARERTSWLRMIGSGKARSTAHRGRPVRA